MDCKKTIDIWPYDGPNEWLGVFPTDKDIDNFWEEEGGYTMVYWK